MKLDKRYFCLGAVAIRNDDVMVYAYKGAPKEPSPQHHCEARLARKLDKGAMVFLARTTADRKWANSKPCKRCQIILSKYKVCRIYYTVAPGKYESMEF